MYERYTDASGVPHKISVPMPNNTRAEQKKARESILTQIERLSSVSCRYRIQDVAEAYYTAQKKDFKNSTYTVNKSQLERVLAKLPNMYADELTAGRIRDAIEKNWSKNITRNDYIRRIKAFLRWAFVHDYIPSKTPIDKLIGWPTEPRRIKTKDKYLEKSELAAVIDTIHREDFRLVTRILALSGMRIGELIALEVSDVDFRNKEIHVTKTYNVRTGDLTSPKSEYSNRDIHMQPELLEAMKDALKWHNKIIMMTGSRSQTFMLTGEGKPICYQCYHDAFKAVTKKIAGRALSPHALRHTHVSLMAAAGVPFDVLSRRLGHGDSAVTREVYSHVTKDLKAADAALFDAVSMI